jgi:N-ethylmaleimide reductase
MKDSLFRPIELGALSLPHRIIMPALTRMRAQGAGVPGPLAVEYYGQRASAAMIITEATAISTQGHGYPAMPGMYSAEQVSGWRAVTDAVHDRGGRIALQIVHHGRWSHSSYNADGSMPVAPSAVTPPGMAFGPAFNTLAYETPRALTLAEIALIVEAFRQTARLAMDAGFDAVEVHGANGFLIDQFLQDGSNLRTDAYGGSIDRRARFLFEVIDGVARDIGADRVGLRLSPHGSLGGLSDSDTEPHFRHVIHELNRRGLAWLHLVEPRASAIGLGDDASVDRANNAAMFRDDFSGPLITAGGYTVKTGAEALASGLADVVAFGRMFIANPDLVERIRQGVPLTAFDRSTAYGGGAAGYTDYPFLEAT